MTQPTPEVREPHSSTVQMRCAVGALALTLLGAIGAGWTSSIDHARQIQQDKDQLAGMSERLGKVEGRADGITVLNVELARVEQRIADLTDALEKKR